MQLQITPPVPSPSKWVRLRVPVIQRTYIEHGLGRGITQLYVVATDTDGTKLEKYMLESVADMDGNVDFNAFILRVDLAIDQAVQSIVEVRVKS